jgi:hypothetical protein
MPILLMIDQTLAGLVDKVSEEGKLRDMYGDRRPSHGGCQVVVSSSARLSDFRLSIQNTKHLSAASEQYIVTCAMRTQMLSQMQL